MNLTSFITVFGVFVLIAYGLTKIMEFYGVGINIYGSYLAFYVFILLSAFILPRNYPTFGGKK